jgi:hypothetical protein
MKEFNLNRLMDSCCVNIDNEYYDELFDYLIELDVDLNKLNIDDLVVNGIQFLDKEEAERQELHILKETEDGCWCV